MDILNQLYHGEIHPVDSPVKDAGNRYHDLMKALERQNADFTDSLIEQQLQEYENITDINGQINLILCELAFQQGYQLGAKLMLAVFQTNQSENS
jgi:hypothetical protein